MRASDINNAADVMSSTGSVVSAAHTESDIDKATEAYEETFVALRGKGS